MMATANYNEVTHAAGSPVSHDYSCLDPLYMYDTRFPDRLSRLHLHDVPPLQTSRQPRQRRMRNRQTARFKTQPITFDEIQEVDEDGNEEAKKVSLRDQFAAFSRSMDGLVPRLPNPSTSPSPEPPQATPPDPDDAEAEFSSAIKSGIAQHERSRARRSKRRIKRGMKEVPELEKEAADTQAG